MVMKLFKYLYIYICVCSYTSGTANSRYNGASAETFQSNSCNNDKVLFLLSS